MPEFITKDSGERAEFDSGMQRDTEAGKPRFDLMLPEGVPFEEQMLTRFAMLLSRGAEKYDSRNWEKANSAEEVERMKSSAFRHFIQWITGEDDEDHASATIFNIFAAETTALKLAETVTYPIRSEATEAGPGCDYELPWLDCEEWNCEKTNHRFRTREDLNEAGGSGS